MGDRVSISFRNRNEESVVLFSHWGGMEFVKRAREYTRELKRRKKGKSIRPLDRLDPETVIVDFIRHITEDLYEVENDLYLGKDDKDGDNSNNGHFVINL